MAIIKRVSFTDGFSSEVTPADTVIGASSFLVGSGVPSSGTGNNGDYYLDADTGNVYLKASGSWSVDSTITLPASQIINTPSGNISATDIQAAINELDSEKLDKSGGTISGDLVVSGDLTVNGDTTTVNTATLDVEDANITVNKGGDQASADSSDAGITVEMSDATDVKLMYDSTATSKFKIGESGSESEIVTLGHAQTLESKTLTSPTINNGSTSGTSIISPSRLDVKQDTYSNLVTYAGSATNGQLCFATDLKKMYHVVDSTLVEVGSGSGSGGFNYFEGTNSSAETDAGDWVVYKNTTTTNQIGSVYAPDDFGGSTASAPITWTQNSATPLIGDSDFKLTKSASSAQGWGIYYEFTAEKAHLATKLLLSVFNDLSELDDNDISIWLVSSSDSFVSDFNYISANNPEVLVSKQTFKQFQLDSSDTEYRICIHYSSSDTTAKNAYFDDFQLEPSKNLYNSREISARYTGGSQSIGTSFSVLKYTTIDFDTSSSYDNSTGTFTAPQAGKYQVSAAWTSDNTAMSVGNALQIAIYKNGSLYQRTFEVVEVARTDSFCVHISGLVECDYGDTIAIYASCTTALNSTSTENLNWLTINETGLSSESLTVGSRSEIYVKADGSDTTGSPAGTDIVFTSVTEDTTGSFDGTTFTVPESGVYAIAVGAESESTTNTGNFIINLIVNGSFAQRIINHRNKHHTTDNARKTGENTVLYKLDKGDEVTFQLSDADSNNLDNAELFIYKLASPQAILETEEVSAIYGKNAGQSFTHNTYEVVEFDIKEYDSHNAVSSGVFTVPVSGRYFVDATIAFQSSGNETSLTAIIRKSSSNEIITDLPNSWNETNQSIKVSGMLNCNKGDTIDIYVRQINGDSSNRTLSATARNYLSIYRIK